MKEAAAKAAQKGPMGENFSYESRGHEEAYVSGGSGIKKSGKK